MTVDFVGNPQLATSATMAGAVEAEDPDSDVQAVVAQAKATSTVSDSIARGLPVDLTQR